MIRMRTIVLTVLAVVLSTTVASAEFYKWVDRDGKEFYTNEKEKIPAQYRDSAQPVEVHEGRVTVEKPSPAGATSVTGKAHKDRNGRGEAYWHRRAEAVRRKLRKEQDQLDLLAKQERDLEHDRRRSAASRKKARKALEKKRARIERKIEGLRHELDVELPDEARKADAYPGWLRE